jgi:hypothetical protein
VTGDKLIVIEKVNAYRVKKKLSGSEGKRTKNRNFNFAKN